MITIPKVRRNNATVFSGQEWREWWSNKSGKQLPPDLTLWQQNPCRYYTRHHVHSHYYHNPRLITPSLYRDLVASDFRNYFYFANFCEQAAVCTWKWSLAKHGSAKWGMGWNAWDLIYFFGLCMELSELGNLHQRRKLFEGCLLSSKKEIICWMFQILLMFSNLRQEKKPFLAAQLTAGAISLISVCTQWGDVHELQANEMHCHS